MDEKQQEKIAIFRYGLIAPTLHMMRQERRRYFQDLAGRELDVPCVNTRKKYEVATFKDWLYRYRKGGLENLKPQVRCDKGISRRISEKVIETVKRITKDFPFLSSAGIYRVLIKEGHIRVGEFAEGTLRECIRRYNLRESGEEKKARYKFEKENINELWTADFMHGPCLKEGRRNRRMYLCAIIDDHSRVIVGWGWYFQENCIALANTLKGAIAVYGTPNIFYCDNGKVFHANYLQLICAKLGIALVHSQPYDSPSRGKVERFFRTVREKFIARIDTSNISVSEFSLSFSEWLDKEYHKEFHSGINGRPIDKYLENSAKTKIKSIPSHEIDNNFLCIITRTVKNDATVSVGGKLYEVPAGYIGRKVELSFPIDTPEKITLMDNGKPILLLKEVNLSLNANKPHTGIHFRNMEVSQDD